MSLKMSLKWFREVIQQIEEELDGEVIIGNALKSLGTFIGEKQVYGILFRIFNIQSFCRSCPDDQRCALNHHCIFWYQPNNKKNRTIQKICWEEKISQHEGKLFPKLDWDQIRRYNFSGTQLLPSTILLDQSEFHRSLRCYGGLIRSSQEEIGAWVIFTFSEIPTEKLEYISLLSELLGPSLHHAHHFLATEKSRNFLVRENESLKHNLQEEIGGNQIIGESPALKKILHQIELVAPTDASVLIYGESGTGKELIAHFIHQMSPRRSHAFVKVNCGAIPRELFESEFFGHVKGAFTGAIQDRIGRFQLAHKGTLFLDEVGEIPFNLQSKLLRVLQEGTFERVGETITQQIDVRVISATNRMLENSQDFRQDLYYRLCVFPIYLPPLRERREDIPLLANYFWEKSCSRFHIHLPPLTHEELWRLQKYEWPGNIRELRNIIERAVILSRNQFTPPSELLFLSSYKTPDHPPEKSLLNTDPIQVIFQYKDYLTQNELDKIERENLIRILQKTNGKVAGKNGAAQLLGVPTSTLYSRIKTYRLTDFQKSHKP